MTPHQRELARHALGLPNDRCRSYRNRFLAGGLKEILDATERMSPVILLNSDHRPWTSDGFRTSWGKACKTAGITGLTFHDLRGTAVSRLALAGCSEAEIATLMGHTLNKVRSILDSHYLNRDPALALAAITKLESRTRFPTGYPTRPSCSERL